MTSACNLKIEILIENHELAQSGAVSRKKWSADYAENSDAFIASSNVAATHLGGVAATIDQWKAKVCPR